MKNSPTVNLVLSPEYKGMGLIRSLSNFLIIAYAVSLSLPITIPWTILTIGIVVMLIHFVLLASKGKLAEEKNIFHAPLTKAIAVFAVAVLLSGAANGGIQEAVKSILGLRGMLVYFWAYWAFTFNPKLKALSTMAILLIGSLAGVSATIEQLTGWHPFSFPYLQGTGFLSGPMAFSGLAQLFSLLAIGIFLKNGYKEFPAWLARPYVFIAILLGNCMGLLFCSERSAWFGAIIALLITSLLVSRRATVFTSISLAATAALGWLLLPVVKERVSALLNWQTDVSVSTRLILWRRAWHVFKESPVFGIGIRRFPHLRIKEALQQGHVALDHAHSNYLHILATTGIVGICSYFYLWFSALKVSYLNQINTDFEKLEQGIYLGIFAGIVSLAVSGLFEYNFGTGQVRLAQWFLLAMLALPQALASDYSLSFSQARD